MDLRASAKKYLPAPVTDMLRAVRYRYDTWSFQPHVVSRRYGPHVFRMNIHDRVAKEWYDRDWELPPEFEILSLYGLRDGARVFDLGAHQCLIAILLSKEVGESGHVVAVEANRHNVQVARRNIGENDASNVELVHALVASANGVGHALESFNSSIALNAGSIGKSTVPSLSIDELTRRHGVPDVVYMDIEGFEIEALKGAVDTLDQNTTWFIELHGDDVLAQHGARNADVLRFFPADRFTAFVCTNEHGEFQRFRNSGTLPGTRCFTVFVPPHRFALGML
jgi:FkbM family methyltransferase